MTGYELRSGQIVALGCPQCGAAHKLIIRQNSKTKEFFLSCQNWPTCNFTQNVPDDLRLKLLGAKGLFAEV